MAASIFRELEKGSVAGVKRHISIYPAALSLKNAVRNTTIILAFNAFFEYGFAATLSRAGLWCLCTFKRATLVPLALPLRAGTPYTATRSCSSRSGSYCQRASSTGCQPRCCGPGFEHAFAPCGRAGMPGDAFWLLPFCTATLHCLTVQFYLNTVLTFLLVIVSEECDCLRVCLLIAPYAGSHRHHPGAADRQP